LFTYESNESKTTTAKPARVDYRAGESEALGRKPIPGIGLIGAGQFASAVLLPALKKLGGIELRGVCTSSGVKASHVARKFDFRFGTTDEGEILRDADIHAVVIATRHHRHAQQVLDSLEAGKHVFVEKPLCLNEEELYRIEGFYGELSKNRAAPVLTVGYNRRFAPMARRLKKFFAWIGEPLVANYRVNAGLVPLDHWVHDPEQGGGRIRGEVCHFVDFIIFVTGSLPVRVSASALPDIGQYKEDNLSATIELANGSIGTITYVAGGSSAFPKERVEVFGGGTTAVLDNFRSLELARGGRKKHHRSRLRQDKGHREEMAAFIDAVRNGGPPPIPIKELFAGTRCTLALVECLKTRSPVQI
jgi:predicted dehydrogenase